METFKKAFLLMLAFFSFGLQAAGGSQAEKVAAVSVEEVAASLEEYRKNPQGEEEGINLIDVYTRFIDPLAPISVPVHLGILLEVENLKEHLLAMKEQWLEKKRREARKDRLRDTHVSFVEGEAVTAQSLPVPSSEEGLRRDLLRSGWHKASSETNK